MELKSFVVVKILCYCLNPLLLTVMTLLTLVFFLSFLVCVPMPQHQLSKPGELRQEYEAEISKVSLKICLKSINASYPVILIVSTNRCNFI